MSEQGGENEIQQTSKYNSAVEQLKRIGELWNKAHTRTISGDLLGWNNVLDKIWSELARDLPENDKETLTFNSYAEKLSKLGKLGKSEVHGFKKIINGNSDAQYVLLLQKEIWLGRLQNKLGKGTSWNDEDEDMID